MNQKPLAIIGPLVCGIFMAINPVFAQGTAFTYQGRLNDTGQPANGNYDLQFALFDAPTNGNQIGSTVTNLAVGVTNGLFTTLINFGPGIFTGTNYWLQIGVETNGGGGNFTTLSALQPLTPEPYAIYSSSAGAAVIASNVTAGSITGASIASGQVVKSLNSLMDAVTLAAGSNVTISPGGNTLTIASTGAVGPQGPPGSATNAWDLMGNAGTSPAVGYFVGTTDNNPLELHVNGERAFRLEPGSGGMPNVIGGAGNNAVTGGSVAVTIGGGYQNMASNNYATVGGGSGNNILGQYGTIAGGNRRAFR